MSIKPNAYQHWQFFSQLVGYSMGYNNVESMNYIIMQ